MMPSETSATHDPQATNDVGAAGDKKKLGLVAVLLVGLLTAILTQPEADDGDSGHDKTSRRQANVTNVALPNQKVDANSEEEAILVSKHNDWLNSIRDLSRISIQEITAGKLFFPEPAAPVLAEAIPVPAPPVTAIVPRNPVQAVYGNVGNQAALVGGTILRSGQPLPSGGKILSVTSDGIHISP